MPAHAHELRPAYLALHEEADGQIRVLWKTPMRGDLRLVLTLELSARTQRVTPIATRHTGSAAVQTWRMQAVDPLRGQSIHIAGLEGTMTDVLVQAELADGTTWTRRLTPAQPTARIPVRETRLAVVGLYLELGLEHILFGIDHLLFVLALLLITSSGRKLLQTVSAFTLAHSITLGLAALGFVHVPQAPVEAIIALSIVFVAAEVVHARRGRASVTVRVPWVVALGFGLMHGFGFAGALTEVGLPQGQIPLALLFFNLGVELGQLLFIAVVLGVVVALRRVRPWLPRGAARLPPYAIGSVAMFWVIERVASF